MVGLADTQLPNESITVTASRCEEIYVEDTRINTDSISNYDNDITVLFTYMNSLHKSWFKPGKICAIYNAETIEFSGTKCDYKKTSLRCGHQDGIWVLRSVITEGDEQASINLLLFDDTGVVIGQSNYTVKKKTKIVTKQKKTVSQQPSAYMSVTTSSSTEDLEPAIIEYKPKISDFSIHQAVAMLYNSIVNY